MNFLDWLRSVLQVEYVDLTARAKNEKLKAQLQQAQDSADQWKAAHDLLYEDDQEDEVKEYWENKIKPSVSYRYPGRPGYQVDPRTYLNPNDCTVPIVPKKVKDKGYDAIAKYCHDKVILTIKYKSDSGENWKFAFETKTDKKGDCEDGAILLANMMLRAGIPYWRMRINAGWVYHTDSEQTGHAYVTYLAEDNKWYVLDWCYWPMKSVDLQMPWAEAEGKYFSVWFSFNTQYLYKKDNLDRGDQTK